MSAARAPLVIAHRGASAYELENTLAAFRAAVRCGADGIELDVHASADGCLFVHHDDIVPPDHAIAQLGSDELRTLKLANGESLPTLREALAAAGSLLVFVEVKSLASQFDAQLFRDLDSGPNPRGYAVHSFDHRVVRRLGRARPALARGVLSSSYLLRPLEPLEDTGATTLWQERAVVDPDLVDVIHAAGRRLFVWTVDRTETMQWLASLHADGICTNVPDTARRVLGPRP